MLPILNSYLRGNETYRSGICPDSQCKSSIVFTSTDYQVQCVACGQRHLSKNLLNIEDLDSNNAFRAMRSKLLAQKPIELIKVNGISNFQCVLISPLLSHYGMNRGGQAELLGKDRVVDQSDFLDCAKIFSSRAFLIEKDHLGISGYGRDPHGNLYLKDTLQILQEVNEGEERLVPLHADGDGHCLVHAVSKCLMGREMFWHPLRLNLVNHLHTRLEMYKAALKDFMVEDEHEWETIIRESQPDYTPPDDQTSGLRNIHIFALSNILRRPIILLDKLTHIINAGDYAATFLPVFVDPVACTDTTGEMNKPIVIAWNSSAHNHFVPLVGIKNRPLPIISRDLLPKVWGVDQGLLDKYIQFDGPVCVIGGKKCMPDGTLQKLFTAMERLFSQKYSVSTGLVSEFNSCMKRHMFFGTTTNDQKRMIESTRQLIGEGKLFRCLNCRSLNVSDDNNKTADLLKRFIDTSAAINTIVSCEVCPINSPCRLVSSDGSPIYQNGDRTTTPSQGSNCACGFKHFWDGNEYDNVPLEIPIRLEFNQRQVDTKVAWFQDDSDPNLNSNAYDIAGKIVNEYYPGEFGSESIIRGVVDMLIKRVNDYNAQLESSRSGGSKKNEEITVRNPYMDTSTVPQHNPIPTKMIHTGLSKQTFHKEQLGVNEDEKKLQNRIHENAPHEQSRATNLANSRKVC
ncbi:Deubiquitinating protein [Oopsacas minuta]|uniref:Deubiquitinating protein n=1 Tax=Oopsacas minuta TaxID=111878 RepID=A0AAV7JEX1_9METZ|nr:Deubiquitinating protein [Oopsacas minuta]